MSDTDITMLTYRVDRLEKDLALEKAERKEGDTDNRVELGKVRVALYALSGTTIASCLMILVGQLLLNHPA